MLEETGVEGTVISSHIWTHKIEQDIIHNRKTCTDKCEDSTVEKMRPYSMCYSTASYEIIQLINGLTKIKVRLDPIELLQKSLTSLLRI